MEPIFSTDISKEQSKDTGMAMMLILLLVWLFTENDLYVKLAIPVLVLNMINPKVFYPLAIIWFGISNLLGSIMSRVLLSLLFFCIVVPIGAWRKLIGKDAMQLKKFKASQTSVLLTRDRAFVAGDLEKPY